MSAANLYALTLQRATAISHACYGNFSAPKAHEVVVARGKVLELLRPDESGKVQSVLYHEVFGVIRSLTPFRLTGATKDYIVVGSDSGRIVILEYDPEKNIFEKVHQETYGKSGCRRVVPGQYLVADPRGRAVMIGAMEKQKLVYILNRDAANRLTISSPLEAHKGQTLVLSCCGVDVGFENPIFACLEIDYTEIDEDETGAAIEEVEKMVTFYELDLGLNHVVRKWSEVADRKANLLITVPGGSDGPGGVLVCAESIVTWKNQGYEEASALIPRRQDTPDERGILIVSFATHKQKDMFFFLLQSEMGDLYKVTLEYSEDVVTNVIIKYFDTIPVTTAMCVLRSGFLFAASEFGNHGLYQFQGLGDDDDEAETLVESAEDDPFTYIKPREPTNLLLVDDIPSLSPITDTHVMDLASEGAPQFYTVCGRGPRSTLRILRHGLEVTEMAVSEMPGNPNAVWTVKKNINEDTDSYIVVSFVNATMVLSIGETVEESTDSGFFTDAPTLAVCQLGQDALVQVHPLGIRHIRSDRRINEWKTPGKKNIIKAAVNNRQVVLALSGGELMLFDLDATGQLNEVAKKGVKSEVACLDIEFLPEGRQRARFLAVGGYDNTVRVLSLDPEDCFRQQAVQSLAATPESLAIVDLGETDTADSARSTLFLNVGLRNGVLQRIALDANTGALSDVRTRFLGSRPVKLFKVSVQDSNAVLALSSRPWLSYNYQSRFHLTPLSYEMLEHADSFSSPQCPEGIVAIAGSTLRIITLERLGEVFNQAVTNLRYTPRKFIVHPISRHIVTIETDHNVFSAVERAKVAVESELEGNMEDQDDADTQSRIAERLELQAEEDRLLGAPKAGAGRWASAIRVYDPTDDVTMSTLELEDNEAAFSICTCVFHDRGGEVNVIVGTAKDLHLTPRSCASGYIHVYRMLTDGRLELIHKTQVEDVPLAVCPFQGRLLAGVGKNLRIYDLGKRKLLRKCENRQFPTFINRIHSQGDRVVVGDIQESFHFVRYHRNDNQLVVFADDTSPRWVTASTMMDYDTVAGGDKFGNIWINRLREEDADDTADPMGARLDKGYLNGAMNRTNLLVNYHVGEIVNSLQKTTLVAGGQEVLVYSTIMGGIGAMVPFASPDDVEFFSKLEMHMRLEAPPLCGREHLAYRSYYHPCKDVIDGDLCEQFNTLEAEAQRNIADDLELTPSQVAKKLEDIRNRNCF